MKNPGKSFLKGFILAPLPLIALFLVFVIAVDPFWRFGSPLIPGFNQLKIHYTHQVRLSKSHQACVQKP
ncbi:MAG: hypothetical protein KGJ06_10070, partial [Pseudomonadota bacterium]|nr:hypothetical protein [Pseudomonadota bacterium]